MENPTILSLSISLDVSDIPPFLIWKNSNILVNDTIQGERIVRLPW